MDNFEVHVTVAPNESLDLLRDWAKRHEIKVTHIVLARGNTMSQPMITFHGSGTLESQLQTGRAFADELTQLGYEPTRIKVEVGMDSPRVPATKEDAASCNDDQYFEHHIKLEIPQDEDLEKLAQVAVEHTAHLSRNAFRTRGDGFQERFVTQRCYKVGKPEAAKSFARFMEALEPFDYRVLDIEKEFVVYDSNVRVDDGWLED